MIQQRQRRFRSATERYRKQTNWDSCLISPGTFFMRQFESYFAKHRSQLEKECGVSLVISNSREFGEGEHKIMKEIRSLPSETPIAIYGLDADLILLGISAIPNHPKVYLVRENVHCAIREFKKEEFLFVNLATLWEILKDEMEYMVEQH
jgi:5'-3' exonuclease